MKDERRGSILVECLLLVGLVLVPAIGLHIEVLKLWIQKIETLQKSRVPFDGLRAGALLGIGEACGGCCEGPENGSDS